ncbi:MAG: cell division protein FtsZ [Candidatus Dadabacteria bacterium]|nr:cell division protein FtsZ [Candidatus Dadabacteria bacterium]MCZ6685914.1 cell division protein FtsZ [Candidatus Dadabacteria bacterium]
MANFELEDTNVEQRAKIKVIGVGGAGGNAVNAMIERGLNGVEFIVANTDAQDLRKSLAPNKLQIGTRTTKGLGSGGDPNLGREAAIEDQAKIAEALEGADMVFITAGMGGGTGTGASPIIAQAAREIGALTIGVVTKPFGFEGPKRNKQAVDGIGNMDGEVDTLIVIPNDRLAEVHKVSILDAFKKADEVLHQAVRGISDIITGTGYINVDFADVKSIMGENGGKALMGAGYAEGNNRAIEAAEAAITSPLLEDISIEGATGILLNVTASPDFGIEELNEACNYIKERAHEDVNLIFGLVFNHDYKEAVQLTVIATGIKSAKAERLQKVVTQLPSEVEDDEFEIPAFIRRRGVEEGQ